MTEPPLTVRVACHCREDGWPCQPEPGFDYDCPPDLSVHDDPRLDGCGGTGRRWAVPNPFEEPHAQTTPQPAQGAPRPAPKSQVHQGRTARQDHALRA